jgi:hypothetical protein
MKIACDVLGTIEGDKQASVLRILQSLISAGHEVVIWSSEYSLASEAVKKHRLTNLDGTPLLYMEKYSTMDVRNQGMPMFDLALEDQQSQTSYLASKFFLMVHEIPYNTERAEQKAQELINWIKG